ALALLVDALALLVDALALSADALALQGIAKFNSLRINEMLYLANNGIGVITPDRCYQILVTDEKLSWTDSLTLGSDGYIYLNCNQLHRSAPLNAGENTSMPPYYIFRLKPLASEVA
ncbi:hypothetical protein LC574_37745, partial [Nostoc sp. CHAB 5715]|nr:hypothetical protein [Nostoc sp. CHAB 5715]